MARPNAGATPSTSKSSGEIFVPIIRCGAIVPESSYVVLRYAAIPENDRARPRTISKSGAENSHLSTGPVGHFSNINTSAPGSL